MSSMALRTGGETTADGNVSEHETVAIRCEVRLRVAVHHLALIVEKILHAELKHDYIGAKLPPVALEGQQLLVSPVAGHSGVEHLH